MKDSDWELATKEANKQAKELLFTIRYSKLYNIVSDFFRGISNVFRWIPIIWNDVDFDYAPLYKVIRFKLLKMEENWKDNTMFVKSKRVHKQIKTARILCDRILDEYVVDNQCSPNGDYNWKRIKAIEKSELELLGQLLVKYSKSWWS